MEIIHDNIVRIMELRKLYFCLIFLAVNVVNVYFRTTATHLLIERNIFEFV